MAAPRATERLRITPRSAAVAVALLGLNLFALRLFAASHRVVGWFLVAGAVAALLSPAVARMSRRMPRGLAVALVGLATLGSVGTTGYFLVNDLVRQTRVLQQAVPERAAELERSGRFSQLARSLRLSERAARFVDEVPDRLRGGTPAEAVRAATTRGLAFLATAVLSLFLLLHGPHLAAGAARQVHDPARRRRVERVVRVAYREGFGYARGSLLMALAAGLTAYALALAAGVPAPLALAVWVALWDIVPLLGAVVGAFPLVALGAVVSPARGVALAGAFVAYQTVEALVFQREVEQATVRVGPFLTVGAGFAGMELYGVGGALLAVLAVALAAAALRDIAATAEAAAGEQHAPL